MSTCHICGEPTNVDGAPYRCSYCQRDVCETHRLPENHWCIPSSDADDLPDEPRRADLSRKRLPGRTDTSTSSSSPDVAPDGSIVGEDERDESEGHWLLSKLLFWR